jgi:hypothetical protein
MARDPWGSTEIQRQIAEELKRIGADDALRDGFAGNVAITPAQLLAALRATPDGAGSKAFYVALQRLLDGH